MEVIMQIGADRSCRLPPTTNLFFPVVITDALVACRRLAITTVNGRKLGLPGHKGHQFVTKIQ